MANVAFLGLGVMGFPMAGWLAQEGPHRHGVQPHGREGRALVQRSTAARRPRRRPRPRRAPRSYSAASATIPTCATIALGSGGVIAAMRAGAIYVDHTTASADVAREIAAAGSKRGVHCLDAPVSGGQAGAENGKLTVMVGGEAGAVRDGRARDPLVRARRAA